MNKSKKKPENKPNKTPEKKPRPTGLGSGLAHGGADAIRARNESTEQMIRELNN